MPHVTRRRFLGASIAAAAASALKADHVARALGLSHAAAQEENSCITTPEQETGPFYIAEEMLRADIAEGKPGVPLTLRILVFEAGTCKPIPNAAVDIWHCDALGVYSGFTKMKLGPPLEGGPGDFRGGPPPGGPPPGSPPNGAPPNGGGPGGNFGGGPPAMQQTDKLTFCRGIQITGADGGVVFHTLFPGFYQGRTNHIHFKVHLGGASGGEVGGIVHPPTYSGGHVSHTGQIFFDEADTVTLMKRAPYNEHKIHRVTQSEDGVFNQQHGSVSIARMHLGTEEQIRRGVGAAIVAIVDPAATPAPVHPAPPG
ncbi:MAG: intradiol ring-cleavage dioxygenase [Candidatus Acidiferrales bacterium]